MGTSIRQLTIRLPESLLKTAKELASKRNISLNRLVRQSLEKAVQESETEQMRSAYEALGEDIEESDVELFFEAQREVVTRV